MAHLKYTVVNFGKGSHRLKQRVLIFLFTLKLTMAEQNCIFSQRNYRRDLFDHKKKFPFFQFLQCVSVLLHFKIC